MLPELTPLSKLKSPKLSLLKVSPLKLFSFLDNKLLKKLKNKKKLLLLKNLNKPKNLLKLMNTSITTSIIITTTTITTKKKKSSTLTTLIIMKKRLLTTKPLNKLLNKPNSKVKMLLKPTKPTSNNKVKRSISRSPTKKETTLVTKVLESPENPVLKVNINTLKVVNTREVPDPTTMVLEAVTDPIRESKVKTKKMKTLPTLLTMTDGTLLARDPRIKKVPTSLEPEKVVIITTTITTTKRDPSLMVKRDPTTLVTKDLTTRKELVNNNNNTSVKIRPLMPLNNNKNKFKKVNNE